MLLCFCVCFNVIVCGISAFPTVRYYIFISPLSFDTRNLFPPPELNGGHRLNVRSLAFLHSNIRANKCFSKFCFPPAGIITNGGKLLILMVVLLILLQLTAFTERSEFFGELEISYLLPSCREQNEWPCPNCEEALTKAKANDCLWCLLFDE